MDKVFSEKELQAILEFENEHLNCNHKPDAKAKITGFTIHQSWGSGIGINTYITCDCCREIKDCTDYDCW